MSEKRSLPTLPGAERRTAITSGRVTAIAAVAENGVLGRDGQLPWHLPADLAHFKALTRGHHLIVGRKTWESVGRPLPGRTFVVVSRQPAPDGLATAWAGSVAAAIRLAVESGDAEPLVAGGSSIYREAFEQDLVDRIELTEVHAEPTGDTFFPGFDRARFREVGRLLRPADAANQYSMSFVTFDREAAVLSSLEARRME